MRLEATRLDGTFIAVFVALGLTLVVNLVLMVVIAWLDQGLCAQVLGEQTPRRLRCPFETDAQPDDGR